MSEEPKAPDTGTETLDEGDVSKLLEIMAEPGEADPPVETPAEEAGVSENTDEAKPAEGATEEIDLVFAPEQEAELKGIEAPTEPEPPKAPEPPAPVAPVEVPKFELTAEEREKMEDGDIDTILAVQQRQAQHLVTQAEARMQQLAVAREAQQLNDGFVELFERNPEFNSIPTKTLHKVGEYIGAKFVNAGPHKVIVETEKFLKKAIEHTKNVRAAAEKPSQPSVRGTGAVGEIGKQQRTEAPEDPTIGLLKSIAAQD